VIDWYQEEVSRLREMEKSEPEGDRGEDWDAFEKNFLKPRLARPA
jgi:hypothetical protein